MALMLRTTLNGVTLWTLLSTCLITGCSDDTTAATSPPPVDGGTAPALNALDQMTAALGGRPALETVTNENTVAAGSREMAGEGYQPGKVVHISEYRSTLTTEMSKPQYALQETNVIRYGFPSAFQFTETVDVDHGVADGAFMLFAPPAKMPLPAARISSTLRHFDLTSVPRLVRKALTPGVAVQFLADVTLDGKPHALLTLSEANQPVIKVFVDKTTFLPSKVETLEDHPPLGDVVVEVFFTDYEPVGKLKLPRQVRIVVDGKETQTETRSSIEINGPAPAGGYAIPAELTVPYDPEHGAFGARSSEWLLGQGHYLGLLPTYYLQKAKPTVVPIAAGVDLLMGVSHHVLLIEMTNYVIAVDAPLHGDYVQQVLAAIKEKYPAKPLKRVISSHFHFDHSGGLREFAAEGGITVMTGKPSEEFIKSVFVRPHTVHPDRLQTNSVPATVEAVDTSTTLTDALHNVQVHRIQNAHADDLVIVYLPKEKLLFVADLYTSPAAEPAPGSPVSPLTKALYDEVVRLDLDVTTVATAHGGPPSPVAWLKKSAGQ